MYAVDNGLFRRAEISPDDQKLAELILYVAWMCEGDSSFGATKLNKLLFFADFRAYQLFGSPITGQDYQALPQGPAPRRLLAVRERLVSEGALVIRERDFLGKRQSQPIALREPDLSGFTPEEIAVVDRAIREWWGRTASEISRASHDFVGWQLAAQGESIPYETALFDDHEPSEAEVRLAVALETAEALSERGG